MAQARKPYTDTKHRRAPQHSFRFRIGGKLKFIKTKVRALLKEFTIWLTEEHVKKAIELNGFGDGQNCAGAVCAVEHAAEMPFPFTGYVDFQTRRAYFSCRNAAATNLPTHCVAALHSSSIARDFDKKAGLRALLSRIQRDGPIPITFHPLQAQPIGRRKGRRTGERKRPIPRGHKLRVMRALEGGLL